MAGSKDRDDNVFSKLRAKGEEVLAQVSQELKSNPRFSRAVEGALRGKEKLDEAAARALESMNLPTRTEFKNALRRIESLDPDSLIRAFRDPHGRRA